jgi:hypothetical protein
MDMNEESYKECGELATERMRYFTGRYMTARDFRDEQLYHLTHRYLHNRMMHGWGVLCGLHVYQHPTEGCRHDRVIVNAGMAVDCCGREIVINQTIVPPPIPWKGKPSDEQREAQQEEGEYAPADRRWYPLLCLHYVEKQIESVPVLYSEGSCDEQRREYSRIAEGYEFEWRWVRHEDLPKYHWKVINGRCDDDEPGARSYAQDDQQERPPAQRAEGGEDQPRAEAETESSERKHPRPCPEDDCYPSSDDKPSVSCLEPSCPPHHCVPLAWIRARPGTPIDSDDIIMIGRPTLRPPGQSLTHVCSINWPHGGVLARGQLERLKRLEVRFDRRLKKSRTEQGECGPYGVSACTFVVQYGGGYEDLDFVTYTHAPHVEHECIAVYPLESRSREYRHDLPYSYLENHMVYVALKCDFILDCHGVAVDGNHLSGLLPSGDGIPGGTFESWFRVVPDHEWEGRQREQNQDEEQRQ